MHDTVASPALEVAVAVEVSYELGQLVAAEHLQKQQQPWPLVAWMMVQTAQAMVEAWALVY